MKWMLSLALCVAVSLGALEDKHLGWIQGHQKFTASLKVEKRLQAPDGRIKPMWVYNGSFPGPLIRASKGEKVAIIVENKLSVPTSIHWHGMFQKGSRGRDVLMSISPRRKYIYEFDALPVGTHWYHAGNTLSHGEGLFGPLVVTDPEEQKRWNYDREEILMMNDWFVEPAGTLIAGISQGLPLPFQSVLVNGKGRFSEKEQTPIETFTVQEGETIRFRVINASSLHAFYLRFDEHPVTVIAVDGNPIKQIETDYLKVEVGARYDLLLKANQSKPKSYWVHVRAESGGEGRALLTYAGYKGRPPKLAPMSMEGKRLKPWRIVAPEPVNVESDSVRIVKLRLGEWTINGAAYPDGKPLLVKRGEVIRMIVQNPTDLDLPFHLHGHQFYVLGQSDYLKLKEPPLRDTVEVPKKSDLVLQWEANNPGRWLFECQIAPYKAMGMAKEIHYD